MKRLEYVRTSEPCFNYYYYLYPPHDSLDVWFSDSPNPVHVSSRYGYSQSIGKTRSVYVNFGTRYGEKPHSLFTFNKNTLVPFERGKSSSNPISISKSVSANTDALIEQLKSETMSVFLNALNNLCLGILSADKKQRAEIQLILNACESSHYLLPCIRNRTYTMLCLITQGSSSLQWNTETVITHRVIEENVVIDKEVSGTKTTVMLDTEASDSSKGGYRISDDVKSKVSAAVNAVIIDTGVSQEEEKKRDKKKKKKKDDKKVDENEERYRGENYKNFLKMMEKKKMDELYEMINNRRLKERFVTPTATASTLTKESFKKKTRDIEEKLLLPILTTSSQLVALMSESSALSREPSSTVNVIIDTNCTHRTKKSRIRSIITSILVTVMKEIGIHCRLFVSCGRYKGVLIPIEDQSLTDVVSFIFDTELIVKLPSTPLDLLMVTGQFNEKDPIVIVGDGMSEQLISSCASVKAVFDSHKDQMYLFCVIGNEEEALLKSNQQSLENQLKANFGEGYIAINKVSDLLHNWEILKGIMFTKEPMNIVNCSEPMNVATIVDSIDEDLEATFSSNKSVTFQCIITSEQNAKFVEILDADLTVTPSMSTSLTLNDLNVLISADNLFDALSSNLFVPNKSTGYVASTSGTSIHIANYIKYIVSKAGDGKLFKKLGSDKVRSYCASIVIDCSSLAFSYINRVHSLLTVLSLLRNISNLQLPCVDIWVAGSTVTRICTGSPSGDLWESNVILSLLSTLHSPCHNTTLPDCIRYACCTSNCRSFSSLMIVLTNGVVSEAARNEIRAIVHGVEMTYIGIGLGQYLNGFKDLFPTMLWSANPALLNQAIMNISNPSDKAEVCYAVPEHEITPEIKEMKHATCFDDMVKNISAIASTYEIALSKNRILDKTESGSMEVGQYNSSVNDLGEDGGFGEYTILFVILYLRRSDEKDENGKIQDEFITEDVLRYGKDPIKPFSPVIKLGHGKDHSGNPIGKGFNILYAFDYETAMEILRRGNIRVIFITCSPGDGEFPSQGKSGKQDFCDSFLDCVYTFSENGGGVFWFLENMPYTYEADRYFQRFYGFEAVGDKEKSIQGGNMMIRTKKTVPKAGHFITIGGDVTDFDQLSKLDFGIKEISEGTTLCKLNEKRLEENGFEVFAMESEGNASIMVRNNDSVDTRGRMIIDTAASKLFLEFTSEGTARWISNAAVWLCNVEQFSDAKARDENAKSGIDMSNFGTDKMKKRPFEKREFVTKVIDFCVTIIMDTTGSMHSYIEATKNNIMNVLETLQEEERRLVKSGKIKGSHIVGQVVEYKDFGDTINSSEFITEDFNQLRRKLFAFTATGGCGCNSYCEDMQSGFERAIKEMKKYRDYNHMILVCGDCPNHSDGGCSRKENPRHHKSFSFVWEMIYQDLRMFPSLKVMFMPVDGDDMLKTARVIEKGLGHDIAQSQAVSNNSKEFANYLIETIRDGFRGLPGIS